MNGYTVKTLDGELLSTEGPFTGEQSELEGHVEMLRLQNPQLVYEMIQL